MQSDTQYHEKNDSGRQDQSIVDK